MKHQVFLRHLIKFQTFSTVHKIYTTIQALKEFVIILDTHNNLCTIECWAWDRPGRHRHHRCGINKLRHNSKWCWRTTISSIMRRIAWSGVCTDVTQSLRWVSLCPSVRLLGCWKPAARREISARPSTVHVRSGHWFWSSVGRRWLHWTRFGFHGPRQLWVRHHTCDRRNYFWRQRCYPNRHSKW